MYRYADRINIYDLFMEHWNIISRFEYGHILVDVLRCSNCHSINLILTGAKRIPLSLTGFIQYVGPTIMFFLGIFAFKEHFDAQQLVTFALIWFGIVLYSISQYVKMKRNPRPE